jgi:tripartite-type tricarboxylate transporter receptor subunit TctC
MTKPASETACVAQVNRRTALGAVLAAGTSFSSVRALAQGVPVRILVGFGPGGPGDFTLRLLAEKMSATLQRPVVVVSVPGAGGQIALQQVRRSAPDGNTLIFLSNSMFTIYPQIHDVQYDPVKEFTPIASVVKFDNAIATGPVTGARTLKELIAWIREHPTQASYGTPAAGSMPHILGVALGNSIGVKMVHVPYKTVSTALLDVVGGRLPFVINSATPMVEMHRAGQLKVLAVSSPERQPLLPDVPTFKEAGVDMTMVTTSSVFGPAGMQPDLVARLNGAITGALNLPDVRDQLLKRGIFLAPSSPQALAEDVIAETKRLKPTLATMGPIPKE